jgi:hypothetical protein
MATSLAPHPRSGALDARHAMGRGNVADGQGRDGEGSRDAMKIQRAGWFIHENAPGVKAVLSDLPAAASINHPFAQYRA